MQAKTRGHLGRSDAGKQRFGPPGAVLCVARFKQRSFKLFKKRKCLSGSWYANKMACL
jgi:hypothetical protein